MPDRKGYREPEAESRRILDRVSREADSSGLGIRTPAGETGDLRRDDPIEYWGSRIGRGLGLAIGIGLTVWLVIVLIRGG